MIQALPARQASNIFSGNTPWTKLVIEGGVPLTGGIEVSGSKNAALPILFACILLSEPVTITNVPNLRDIHTTIKLLNMLGCTCEYNDHRVQVQPGNLLPEAPYDLVRTMARLCSMPRPVAGPHRSGARRPARRLRHWRAPRRPAPQGSGADGRQLSA